MAVSVQNRSGVPSPIIPLSLTQNYQKEQRDQDEIRQDIQEWQYDFYSGDYYGHIYWLEEDIKRILGNEIIDDNEWFYDFINLTKKFIDRMAIVYKQAPLRTIASEIDSNEKPITDYLDFILPNDINSKDKRTHRYSKLFNTVLPQVYFNKRTGKIDFQIEPSHKLIVKSEEDDYEYPIEVKYRKYFGDELYTVVWTPEEHYKADAQGIKSEIGDNNIMINPIKDKFGNGVLPFPVMRMEHGENFWGVGQCDIVNLNETVNFLKTFCMNDSIIMGSGGTLLGINLGDLKNMGEYSDLSGQMKIRTGRRHLLKVDNVKTDETQPSLQYIGTNPLIAEIQNYIDYEIKQLAVVKGLNPNTIISEIKDTSDAQKQMDAAEMIEVRQDDLDACRDFELQRFEIIKAVNNTAYKDRELRTKWGLKEIPWDAELKIDFADIKIEPSQDQLWNDRTEREKRNMATPIDWMMEENPELTQQEAENILQKNRELNSQNNRQPSRMESLINRAKSAQNLNNQGATQ